MIPTLKSTKKLGLSNNPASENLEDNSSEAASGTEDVDNDNYFTNVIEDSTTSKRKLYLEEDSGSDYSKEDSVNDDGSSPPKKKRKKKKKPNAADTKPPTAEEMIRLRETENLFHSNLFRLQIEEMIKEVRTRKSERNQMKYWLEQLKEFLLNININENTGLHESSYPKSVRNPLPYLPIEEVKVPSRFHKPLEMCVIGSYSAGCPLGPSLSADVAVVVSKKCFLKEDYLNARYNRKRAVYLALLAQALQACDLVDKGLGVRWVVPDGDSLSPRLTMSPSGKLSSVRVTLTVIPQSTAFKLSRFMPGKNNIRESWIFEGEMDDCQSSSGLCNTSVMKDLVMMSNEAVRKQALENNNNLKDSITLLRVWLRQRQLDVGSGGISGYLVSMLVVGLSLSRRLNNLMSSYQIVRNVWLVISQSDWTTAGFSVCTTKQDPNCPSLDDFHRHFDVVFVDPAGFCNLAAHVDRVTYLRVKSEAELAVQCLDNPNMNSFQALFMTPMPFIRQYDHIISVHRDSGHMARIIRKECTVEERTNYCAAVDRLYSRIVCQLLVRGLAGRIAELMHKLEPLQEWPVGGRPEASQRLLIGLRLTPNAYNVIEKGPPANEPQAAEFRALWSKKCDLRRFRDGSICEAVVFDAPTAPLSVRRLITKRMAIALLCKLGVRRAKITYVASTLESFVTEKIVYVSDVVEKGSGEEAALAVLRSFNQLSKQLRELPDLPLEVVGVQGVSAVCRGAEVFPPLPRVANPLSRVGYEGPTSWLLKPAPYKPPVYIHTIHGVVHLGLSKKWPDDLEAIRRLRAAFHLTIAKAVRQQFDLETQAFPEYCDVFKDGYVFRLLVTCPNEVALLKQCSTPDGKLYYRDTTESVALERLTLHLPKLNAALHGVQQQWPACGVTWRLAKRWLSSQLLDDFHFPEIATELMVASMFLSPEPYHSLMQPQPMFLRFLHLLAHTNWQLEHIIVNFNGELKRDDLTEIESQFRSERLSLPPLFIATPYDKSGSVWTKEAPLLPVLVRVTHLAAEALSVLEEKLLRSTLLNEFKVIFRPPLELYDGLIHLKPYMLTRINHRIDFETKEPITVKTPQGRAKMPIADFDPAQLYLKQLRDGYSEFALFFHDTFGGSIIGILFKPQAFEKHDFKVSFVNCRKPVKEGKTVSLEFNLDAIIEDFYNLGYGLVKTIHVSPKHSKNK